MNQQELKRRTKAFAIEVIRTVESLPNTATARVLGRQVLRSGTSVGANYRAACRAKSKADFVSKMGYVEEEADETAYWLDLMIEAGLKDKADLDSILQEAEELTAISVASIKSARLSGRLESAIRNPQPETTSGGRQPHSAIRNLQSAIPGGPVNV